MMREKHFFHEPFGNDIPWCCIPRRYRSHLSQNTEFLLAFLDSMKTGQDHPHFEGIDPALPTK